MALRSESLRQARIQVTTLGDLLLLAADRYPDSPALIFPGQRLTYGELADRAIARARSLQALGVQARDHVGLLLPTSFEFIECLFAIALCGAVAVPMNARYKYNELAYVIENGDLVCVITTDQVAEHVNFVDRLTQALPRLAESSDPMRLSLDCAPRLRNLVLMGESAPPGFLSRRQFEAFATESAEDRVHESRLRVRLRDIAIMLYTSGTTANPKGCLLTHEAMVRNSIALGRIPLCAQTRGRVLVAVADISHRRDPAAMRDLRRGRRVRHDGVFRCGHGLADAGARAGHCDLPVLRHNHVRPHLPSWTFRKPTCRASR